MVTGRGFKYKRAYKQVNTPMFTRRCQLYSQYKLTYIVVTIQRSDSSDIPYMVAVSPTQLERPLEQLSDLTSFEIYRKESKVVKRFKWH